LTNPQHRHDAVQDQIADDPKYIHHYFIIKFHHYFIIEGSLEVKLPTIWTEKQSRAEAERRERLEERRSEEKESEERRWRCAKR